MTRVLWVAALAATGCYDLSEVEQNVCGNGVLEAGEDCDGSAPDAARCAGPDEPGQCFLVCTDSAVCPSGYGCGLDGVCRRASGTFDVVEVAGAFPVEHFAIGDVDGDAHADIIGHTLSEIVVRYGDDTRTFATTVETPTRVPRSPMTFGEFDGDALLDAVVPIEDGIVVMRGDASRALQSIPFAPFSVPTSEAEVFAAESFPNGITELVVLLHQGAAMGFVGQPDELMVTLPGPVSELTRPVAVAEVDGDGLGRREIALGFTGESQIHLYTSAGVMLDDTSTLALVSVGVVPLPGPLGAGALFADVDGDGDQDLVAEVIVAGGEGRLVVAFNEAGGLVGAVPVPGLNRFDVLASPGATALPLAAGDLDGDGRADYVFPEFAALAGGGPGSPAFLSPIAVPPAGNPWTDAVVVDLNRDGVLDFATGYERLAGVDFYLRGEGVFANRFHIDAEAPAKSRPRSLQVGDFDGDLVQDVAFIEDGRDLQPDSFTVAYGAVSGGFGDAVAMARFGRLRQAVAAHSFSSLQSLDSITDVTAVAERGSGDAASLEISILYGDSSRMMIAPFALVDGDPRVPEGVLIGEFNGDESRDLLVVAHQAVAVGGPLVPRPPEVWFLPGRGPDGAIESSQVRYASVSDQAEFNAACATWAVGNLDPAAAGDYSELIGIDQTARCNFFDDDLGRTSRLVMIQIATSSGVEISGDQVTVGDGVSLTSPESVELADLDGDGTLDVLVLFRGDFWVEPPGPDDAIAGAGVAVLWNRGGASQVGYADPAVLIPPPGRVAYLAARGLELDGDGTNDVVTLTDQGIFGSVYDAEASSFGVPALLADGLGAEQLEVGDLDGDGVGDFAFVAAGILRVGFQRPVAPAGDAENASPSTSEGAR